MPTTEPGLSADFPLLSAAAFDSAPGGVNTGFHPAQRTFMDNTDRPRLNVIAGPILGEFLLGYTVVIVGLWLASHTSDGAAGSLGLHYGLLAVGCQRSGVERER